MWEREGITMIRAMLSIFTFATLLLVAGCSGSGQPTATNDDWFRKQNEEFDRQRANHIKQSSDAVRDYQRYRNRQP